MPDVDWTPDPVARAREALEGVTPGPWAQAPWHDRTILPKAWADDPDEVPPENRGPFSTIYAQHKADARFIAWARTGVPDLIAHADAQARRIALLQQNYDEAEAAHDELERLTESLELALRRRLYMEAEAREQAAELERLRRRERPAVKPDVQALLSEADAYLARRGHEMIARLATALRTAETGRERERALADRLTEALRTAFLHVMEPDRHGAPIHAALAAWRAAREAPDA